MYKILRVDQALDLTGRVFDPQKLETPYAALETANISIFPWDKNGYRPEAFAKVGWSEAGLHVLMAAKEDKIVIRERKTGGMVCLDNCLEFFFSLRPPYTRYVNCELNAGAFMRVETGVRGDREVVYDLPEGFHPTASVYEGGWWAVSFTAPVSYLGTELMPGMRIRGNFYKCGGEIEHYGAYNLVGTENPDYHRPEFFAEMTLA